MSASNSFYNSQKTLLVSPEKERFPIHESEKQYIVTARSFMLKKIGSGLLAILMLLSGIYLIFNSSNLASEDRQSEMTKVFPSSTPGNFVRVDPEKVGLPQGWERAKSQDGSFDIGYNPQIMQANVIDSVKIELKGKDRDISFSMELFPFEGGGRHEFILKKMRVVDLNGLGSDPNTHEQIYDIGQRRALIIYGVDYRGITVIGMLPKDQLHAFLIQASGLTQREIEEILYTIRIY